MQTHLSLFSEDVTLITPDLGFQKRNGVVYYFYAGMPVFSHDESDGDSFRMILSQFYINGNCKQAELVKAFGLVPITLKRWVKQYRQKGPGSFYHHDRPRPQPRVLTPEVIAQAERLLADGRSRGEVAAALGVKKDTLQKAMKHGRVRAEKKTAIR